MDSNRPAWLKKLKQGKHKPISNRDGICDYTYPGSLEGRCMLPFDHTGSHIYRERSKPRPTREQRYQEEREEKKRKEKKHKKAEKRKKRAT